MTGRAPILVVGSYPPIPRPASAASVAAVRRSWDSADEVTVVSPRPSAAHLSVPIVGILAARRLENVRRYTGATRMVLVAETGFPLTDGSLAYQWVAAVLLSRALQRFEHVTLVKVGSLGIGPSIERLLLQSADEVMQYPADPPPMPGVTAVGPTETLPRERPRQVAGFLFRRLLGPRASSVRLRLEGPVQAGHALIRRLWPGSRPS